jgi:hypothetical protein
MLKIRAGVFAREDVPEPLRKILLHHGRQGVESGRVNEVTARMLLL